MITLVTNNQNYFNLNRHHTKVSFNARGKISSFIRGLSLLVTFKHPYIIKLPLNTVKPIYFLSFRFHGGIGGSGRSMPRSSPKEGKELHNANAANRNPNDVSVSQADLNNLTSGQIRDVTFPPPTSSPVPSYSSTTSSHPSTITSSSQSSLQGVQEKTPLVQHHANAINAINQQRLYDYAIRPIKSKEDDSNPSSYVPSRSSQSTSQPQGSLPTGVNAERITTQVSSPVDTQPHFRQYATMRAHTPIPSTSSNEGLNNNIPKTLHRKKKSVVMQHTEVVQEVCTEAKCKTKLCPELCAEPAEPPKSIGHLTHSDREGLNVQKISDGDVDGDINNPQFMIPYQKPHETSGDSIDSIADAQKTKALKQMFQDIYDNEK